MTRPPVKTPGLLMSLIWGISYIMTRPTGLKMHKSGMRGVKPPYLVLSTHQGFADYYIAPLIMFPHRPNYISDMEGFAAFGKNIYRDIGCIGKRRYVPDLTVMRNIEKAFDMGNPVVVYPEARHSNIGTTHVIPKNMGRLAKYFAKHNNTPLVMLRSYGVYLTNPFWDEEHTRRGKMDATLELVYTADELMKLDEETIQANSRFFESISDVPRYAVSMGIKTIMMAEHVVLLANGKNKAKALYQAVCGDVTPEAPASILQLHRDVAVVVDQEAAAMLPQSVRGVSITRKGEGTMGTR